MVMLEVKEVSHFLGGGVSSAFLQPHYLSLGLLVPHFISSAQSPQLNSGHKALKRDSGVWWCSAKRVYMSHNVPVDILWPWGHYHLENFLAHHFTT